MPPHQRSPGYADALSTLFEIAKTAATWRPLVGAKEDLREPSFRSHGSTGRQGFLSRVSESSALMGNRLYVGNLSFNANADTVREAFAACGDITDVQVMSDRETG